MIELVFLEGVVVARFACMQLSSEGNEIVVVVSLFPGIHVCNGLELLEAQGVPAMVDEHLVYQEVQLAGVVARGLRGRSL